MTGLAEAEIVIFDRSGQVVYRVKDMKASDSWSGTLIGGSPAPEGTYFYMLNLTSEAGTYQKKGFIEVVR